MLCLKGVDNGPYTTTAQKDYAPHDRVAVNGGVACDGRRDRDHRQPLALVLISHDPDAARSALR